MRRREFVALVGATAAATWPFAARSQEIGKIPHLGILNPGTAQDYYPSSAPHTCCILTLVIGGIVRSLFRSHL